MDKNYCVHPTGELQGDDKPMPDRGTGTGVTETYGADIGESATNRQGSITRYTKSDPMNESVEEDPTFGGKDGDE